MNFVKNDPLFHLFRRVHNTTNGFVGYNSTTHGQGCFIVIQYGVHDQYSPHCGGSCDDDEFCVSGRIASAVIYCQLPEIGDGTTFTRAGVFLKPKRRSVKKSYRGPNACIDHGYTETP